MEDILVSTEWLVSNINNDDIFVIEVNAKLSESNEHIPSALVWDLHQTFENSITLDVINDIQFKNLMEKNGINNDSTIILYGDGDNRSATYAFWVFKYYRHNSVKILDGSIKKWKNDGNIIDFENDISGRQKIQTKSNYEVKNPDLTIRITKDQILKNIENFSIIDVRTFDEFLGKSDGISTAIEGDSIRRRGRIPGAKHLEWTQLLNDDGTFKSIDKISEIVRQKNIVDSEEIITYCRLGVRASYVWFALKYLLGFSEVKNYDGSWTEWGNSVGVPIEID
ncbi:MAG: sulfurtransferase [SAR202 cluster bacterium]|nr:sulfurtransferase [SAR202 cluster bacterium]